MKRAFLAVASLLPFAAPAQEELSFDYVDVGLIRADVIDPDTDERTEFSGFGLRGSVELREHVHLFGSYSSIADDDAPGIDIDSSEITAGVGVHWTFREGRFGVYGRLGVIKASIHEATLGDDDDDGVYAAVGARFIPARGFEIRAGLEHFDLDFGDPERGSETSPMIAGDIYLTDVVALTLQYVEHDDADQFTFGVRFAPQREGRR